MKPLLFASLAVLALPTQAAGQVLLLPPQPVAPGSVISVTLINDTGFLLYHSCGAYPFWIQHADGSAVIHVHWSDCFEVLLPNSTTTFNFLLPASGPGSSGSFVFRAYSAAVRLDVGTASASFPAIHAAPREIGEAWDGHTVLFTPNFPSWAISNTGTGSHTFGAGDVIRIFTPGGVVPVATMNLAGIAVPPLQSVALVLPIAGLVPGPYTVEMSWLDPGVGSAMTVRHGIREHARMSLDLPGGHEVPAGGALPVEFSIRTFPWNSPAHYAFCIGALPGSTPMPGGFSVPLVLDAVVLASLVDGIGGLLTNNVGALPPLGSPFNFFFATGIGITHPGPAFSGVVVRAAAVAFDPITQLYGASQGEDIVVQ
jgi:hypothetical protein